MVISASKRHLQDAFCVNFIVFNDCHCYRPESNHIQGSQVNIVNRSITTGPLDGFPILFTFCCFPYLALRLLHLAEVEREGLDDVRLFHLLEADEVVRGDHLAVRRSLRILEDLLGVADERDGGVSEAED